MAARRLAAPGRAARCLLFAPFLHVLFSYAWRAGYPGGVFAFGRSVCVGYG